MTIAASHYQWLLFLHVLAAMAWVGGAILLGALANAVLRTRQADAVESLGAPASRALVLGIPPHRAAARRRGMGHGVQAGAVRNGVTA